MPTLFQDFNQLFLVAAMGAPRFLGLVFFLPFFNAQILGGDLIRLTVVLLVSLGLAPMVSPVVQQWDNQSLAVNLFIEAGIGLIAGLPLAMPFWIGNAFGEIIDNQRGATISNTIDPAVGIDVSPYSSFMLYFWGAAFLLNAGMRHTMELLAQSYRVFPLGGEGFVLTQKGLLAVIGLVDTSITKGLILAAPAVITMMLTESTLGLLSKFAPQLNAFSVALSIKSFIAFSILLIYFSPIVPDALLKEIYRDFGLWQWFTR